MALNQLLPVQSGRPSTVGTGGAATLFSRRGVGSVASSRSVGLVTIDPSKPEPSAMNACAPVLCNCCEFWTMPPGVTWPLRMDWSRWLDSVPGFNGIQKVLSVELVSNTPGDLALPDPEDIAIVSGSTPDPPEDTPGWTNILGDGSVTETLIRIGADVRIGTSYRLNISVQAVDCGRRAITSNDCVIISVQQC